MSVADCNGNYLASNITLEEGAQGSASVCLFASPTRFGYTSFEEPAAAQCPSCSPGCSQTECGSSALAILAANNCSGICEVPNLAGIDGSNDTGFTVSYTSVGGEMGFTAYWESCGNNAETIVTAVGLPACNFIQDDHDNMGVISNVGDIGETAWGAVGSTAADDIFPDGNQVYMIDDPDGFAFVTLDTLFLPAPTAVSIWTHISSTSYEFNDIIRVWVDCSDGSTYEVLTGELDTEAHPVGADGFQLLEDQWTRHTALLPATCGEATLSFGCQANANDEECWFDMIGECQHSAVPQCLHAQFLVRTIVSDCCHGMRQSLLSTFHLDTRLR